MTTRQRTWSVIYCVFFGMAAWHLVSDAVHAAEKAPVPSADAQNAALALVKDTFSDEYAQAGSSAEKSAFAVKLLETAEQIELGSANHYALLRVAWDIATQAGDAKLAMRITDGIAGAYDVNALIAKVATIKKAAEAVRSSTQRTALATAALNVVNEAVAVDDYNNATEIASIGLAAARKAQDWQLVKQIVARQKEIKETAEAHAKIQMALATLEGNPTDPDANQAAGVYFCFVKGAHPVVMWRNDHGQPGPWFKATNAASGENVFFYTEDLLRQQLATPVRFGGRILMSKLLKE